MNCADFQRVLPEIMESGGGNEESAHLRSCAVCSDLVQDLKYIAEAARMLVPMEDPSPRVWAGIEDSLQREGLIRPSRGGTVRLEPFLIPGARRGNVYAWSGIAALALVAISMLVFNRLHTSVSVGDPSKGDINISQATPTAADVSDADKPLISAIAQKDPAMGETYKKKLRNADAYIYDARRSLQQNPDDDFARQQLMNAYQQRQMVYESAVSYTTH